MPGVKQRGVQGKIGKGDIFAIAITKAKQEIEINTGDLPDEVYLEALAQGLKAMLNKGMADIKTTGLEGDHLAKAQAVAMEKAQGNLTKMLAGEIRKSASKATKVAGKVMTEAKRLARNFVKDQLRAAGHKVSHYSAAEITKAAVAMIEADASWVKLAEESLSQAAAKTASIDLEAIKTDPKLVAKAESKKKGEGKAPLSATQAGIVAPRQRPTIGGQGPRPGQVH